MSQHSTGGMLEPFAHHRGGLVIEFWSSGIGLPDTHATRHSVLQVDTRRWENPCDLARVYGMLSTAYEYGQRLVDKMEVLTPYDLSTPQVINQLVRTIIDLKTAPHEAPSLYALYTAPEDDTFLSELRLETMRMRILVREAQVAPVIWFVEHVEATTCEVLDTLVFGIQPTTTSPAKKAPPPNAHRGRGQDIPVARTKRLTGPLAGFGGDDDAEEPAPIGDTPFTVGDEEWIRQLEAMRTQYEAGKRRG